MADTTSTPMTDKDVVPPPATTEFEAAAPLKDAHVAFEPSEAGVDAPAGATIRDKAESYSEQVTQKLRAFAATGQERAGGALDQIAQYLDEAAAQVDDKLGGHYGQYARSAAGTVRQFSGDIRDKDIDDLLEDARALVRKSPAAAVGVAATIGFIAARLVQAGIDAERRPG